MDDVEELIELENMNLKETAIESDNETTELLKMILLNIYGLYL